MSKNQIDKSVPMDPSARETDTPEPVTYTRRECWAMETLREEVLALFPETPFVYGEPNGRNTLFDITFEMDDDGDMGVLLACAQEDERIKEVIVEEGQAHVEFVRHPLLMDSRDSFHLAEALHLLREDSL